MNIIQEDYDWNGVPEARQMSTVTVLIFHHSAGPITETVEQIHEQHLAQGWKGIGYNAVIYHDGSIHQGRPFDTIPAATEGYNSESIAVCVIGNFQPDDKGYTGSPTLAQLDAVDAISIYLHKTVPSISATKGHRDFNATACPGQVLYTYLDTVREKTAQALHGK